MKILSCAMFILCCFIAVPAQERVMDKSEFEALVNEGHKHQLRWKGQKYRMTVTTSTKAVGRPQTDFSSKMISEYGSATENRMISSSAFGEKTNPTREVLRVGNWVYSRSGNEPWTRKEYAASNVAQSERPESPVQIIETNAQYKYLGPGYLKDKPAHIYVKTERQTKVGKKSGETMQTDSKVTYWIDPDGMILKHEYVAETRGSNVSQTLIVMLWERDPSISFAVPEIVP